MVAGEQLTPINISITTARSRHRFLTSLDETQGTGRGFVHSGGGIRTRDLRVMSLIRWIGWTTWS